MRTIIPVLGSFLALFGVVTALSIAYPGVNAVLQTALAVISLNPTSCVIAFGGTVFGLICGLGISSNPPLYRNCGTLLYFVGVFSLTLVLLKDVISPYWASSTQGPFSGAVTGGFEIEEVVQLPHAPTCLAVGLEGDVFVAGFAGMAFQNGIVTRVEIDAQGRGKISTVADYLNRPHGLAIYDGDLYISRAGQFSQAIGGKIVQENTGAITRLRDMDQDGEYDHFVDILDGLPGAQQPDGLHQNNGIAFDSEGFLYVTVGMPSDHGPSTHPFAGTILKVRADGSDPGVFVRGLRNPYGIAITPDGTVFCTDNDASIGLGDKVIHAVEGQHYGHPYDAVDKGISVSGTSQPLMYLKSAQGIAYAPPDILPDGFDSCLYVAGFGDDSLHQIILNRTGNSFVAKVRFFAKIPGIVDVAISSEGIIYAVSHSTRKLYRIVRKEK